MVQAVLMLEGKQLAPLCPSPAPASQELYFLSQCQQGDTRLKLGGGGSSSHMGQACTCTRTQTHTPIQLQGPAWHRGLP